LGEKAISDTLSVGGCFSSRSLLRSPWVLFAVVAELKRVAMVVLRVMERGTGGGEFGIVEVDFNRGMRVEVAFSPNPGSSQSGNIPPKADGC
jgi:hypothetical protein